MGSNAEAAGHGRRPERSKGQERDGSSFPEGARAEHSSSAGCSCAPRGPRDDRGHCLPGGGTPIWLSLRLALQPRASAGRSSSSGLDDCAASPQLAVLPWQALKVTALIMHDLLGRHHAVARDAAGAAHAPGRYSAGAPSTPPRSFRTGSTTVAAAYKTGSMPGRQAGLPTSRPSTTARRWPRSQGNHRSSSWRRSGRRRRSSLLLAARQAIAVAKGYHRRLRRWTAQPPGENASPEGSRCRS